MTIALFRARQLMSWRFCLSGKTVRKFEELGLPIYCQRQNCSPGIPVSSKVRFIWIFAGVCWRGDVKWKWGRRKWRFSLLSLAISCEPSHSRPCSPLVVLHWHRNRWPWMTLNGHFELESGSSSASNGLTTRSGFRRKLLGNLQSYRHAYCHAAEMYPSVISVMGYSLGFS